MDYVCITNIAKRKNPSEPKDIVKNGMSNSDTLECLGLWEKLNNLKFKGDGFHLLLKEADTNAFTMITSK